MVLLLFSSNNVVLSQISGIDCSGNGICIEGVCTCNGGWGGLACHLENCPDNCGASHNRGICEPEKGCSCFGTYKGDDCSQIASHGFWEAIKVQGYIPQGSASHGAAVWRDSMYIIAGESYNKGSLLFVYDFNGKFFVTFVFDSLIFIVYLYVIFIYQKVFNIWIVD